MVRVKMPRSNRAKQFAPFDALKGLQESLRLKEYEHERIVKCDIMEEKAMEISATLSQLKRGDIVKIKYYFDGYEKTATGFAKLDILNGTIDVDNKTIALVDILDISLIER